MSNNQLKKIEAEIHNANRIDMKCPPNPKQLPSGVAMKRHDDMLEFTIFDTENMTFTKRFDTLLNGKHTTLPFEPVTMEAFNETNEAMIEAQARVKFIEKYRSMIIH